jgi:hypothetical protein
MVKKFSTFSVENLDSTCTAHEYAFNTVYNTDTHTLLDITDIVQLESTVIFESGVKTEVISPQFLHNSILSGQDKEGWQ